VIAAYVETSGEHAELARGEVAGAVEALGGLGGGTSLPVVPGLVPVRLPRVELLPELAGRLALARRVLVPVGGSSAVDAARLEGSSGRSAEFRRIGRPGAVADAAVREAGRAYVLGGGTVDLERPGVRYWLAPLPDGTDLLLREAAEVARKEIVRRAMPRLPFRRPVSLPPRLARAAVNLAAVRAGDRVLDPFLGTGALLAEAALLGAHVYGVDADPTMVRGALRNLEHLGVRAEAVVEGDARGVEFPEPTLPFDAIVTDPPYGRSSASVGAEPARLVTDVLGRWQAAMRPGGRIVVIAPGGPPSLGAPWAEETRFAVRVHRSLTREFRRYRRTGEGRQER
jgi:putative methyltransferase (TIGR01177 family)